MNQTGNPTLEKFRIWLAEYENWQPSSWSDVPPRSVALEPVCEELLSATEAAMFLQGFNEASLPNPDGTWAVAVPIVLRYDGEPAPGEIISGACDLSSLAV